MKYVLVCQSNFDFYIFPEYMDLDTSSILNYNIAS